MLLAGARQLAKDRCTRGAAIEQRELPSREDTGRLVFRGDELRGSRELLDRVPEIDEPMKDDPRRSTSAACRSTQRCQGGGSHSPGHDRGRRGREQADRNARHIRWNGGILSRGGAQERAGPRGGLRLRGRARRTNVGQCTRSQLVNHRRGHITERVHDDLRTVVAEGWAGGGGPEFPGRPGVSPYRMFWMQ